MIEIVVLYFLVRKLGKVAEQKGLSPFKWKINGILAWVGGEFFGFVLILELTKTQDIILSLLFAIGCGYLCFLLLRQYLQSMPDSNKRQ